MAWNTDRTPRLNRRSKEYTLDEALNRIYRVRYSSKGYNGIVSFPKALAGKLIKIQIVGDVFDNKKRRDKKSS